MKLATILLLALSFLAAPAFADADAKSLAGKWSKSDNPKIQWTFGADGSYATHTPALDNKGTFKINGAKLETKLKDLPGKTYTIVEASAHKLVLKDDAYSMTLEFTK